MNSGSYIKHASNFANMNSLQHSLPSLSLWLTSLVVLIVFPISAFGQVAIPLSQLNSELNEDVIKGVTDIEVIGDQLFVGTENGLWVVNKSGMQSQKVRSLGGGSDSFEGSGGAFVRRGGVPAVISRSYIYGIEAEDNRLFAVTPNGLWIINGKWATKVEGVKVDFDSDLNESDSEDRLTIKASGERLFIQIDKELWVVHKGGEHATKVEGAVQPMYVEAVGDQIFMIMSESSTSLSTDLWVVRKDSERATKIRRNVDRLEAVGDQLFMVINEELWLANKDGEPTNKVKGINEKVSVNQAVGDQLFLSNIDDHLWIVSKDGKRTTKVEGVDGFVYEAVGDQMFVAGPEGSWLISKDGTQITNVVLIKEVIPTTKIAGEQLFVGGFEGLWIVSKDGKADEVESMRGHTRHIKVVDNYIYVNCFIPSRGTYFVYRIEPKVTIKSKLVPSSWWTTVVGYVLPSNWLPAEKVQATASYSNEDGKDPYDQIIPKEFRFAKAERDAMPSDDKFSTAEQFGYEIGWGRNEVHYWVKDKWGNAFEHKATYHGVPSQYFFVGILFILPATFVLGCFALAPKVGFCHSAIMNPWLRNYFSLGSIPLLLSVFPPLRRHLLRRYSSMVNKDKEFSEWKNRFVCPDEEFYPENFGKKLESERRLLLTGQSGIGKTSYFKRLTANYASQDKPTNPAKVFPVYIPLTNYGGNSLEDLVYNQLFSYGKITDKELAPMFLEHGGLLIFLDGVNEVQHVSDRQKLSAFIEKFWASNYICLSSQHPYPEIENIPKVELKPFSREKVCEFIKQRVNDKRLAEDVIKKLTDDDFKVYSIPRDLEFAVEILNGGAKSLPRSRAELYKTVFSSIFAKWEEEGASDAEDNLCKHAYIMVVQRDLSFDSVDDPHFKQITADLFEQRFLVRRERSYYFRHELIRSYLASEYFYPRWKNLFEETAGKAIDSNWLEMLKFSCENIGDPTEVKSLVYEVLKRSVRKDLVKNLFEWLKTNHPSKCRSWEKDFYTKYGELDFKGL